MYGKSITFKDCERILKNNGYTFKRQSGDHHIFENSEGDIISLPYKGKAMSQKTWKREFKKHNLKELNC